jgi:phospholipid/cholesterol/gamma-HCH transport system substrate-binding protein
MSDTRDSNVEFKAGLFLLVGLAVVGGMIVYFGGLGQAFGKSYRVTVELPDASGLLKDSSVLLAGARIGKVATAPKILFQPSLLSTGAGVEVTLEIDEGIRIPAGSEIQVGSAGLLGDRFVAVRPPAGFDGKSFIEPGAKLAGTSATSLEDLQREGAQLIVELRGAVSKINTSLGRIESEFLGNETIGDLKQVFANIKNTSESFAAVSSKITGLVDGAGEALVKASTAIESVSGTLAKGGETMENANKAAEDLRAAIADVRKFVATAQGIADRGASGGGLLNTVLNDRKLAADLSALAGNLRKHGLLFYRDSAEPDPAAPGGVPAPPRAPASRPPAGRPR